MPIDRASPQDKKRHRIGNVLHDYGQLDIVIHDSFARPFSTFVSLFKLRESYCTSKKLSKRMLTVKFTLPVG